MNVGQVYEAHLSMSLMDLKKKIREMYKNSNTSAAIYNYVLEYIKIIDMNEGGNY